jgi:hypothetical protein
VNVSPKQAEEAVIRAKKAAQAAGVGASHIDAVAAALAAVELLNNTEAEEQPTQMKSTPRLPETFGEWARKYALKSATDHFLAIAVYLYEFKQMEAITIHDIAQMYDKARWEKPKNLPDVFAKAAQRLHFAETDEPAEAGTKSLKMWRITRTGYDYLDSIRKEN